MSIFFQALPTQKPEEPAKGPERRAGYTYSIFGLLSTATTYSNVGGTLVMSQVEDVYNGFGQLTTQYQEHNGAVNTTTSADVQYAYGTAANGSRLLSMMYPNQRQLDYVYNAGLDSSISRVSALADDSGSGSGTLASYLYLGAATIVQQTNANNTALTAIQQTGDTLASSDGGDRYTGLDRFGRNIDQNYINTTTGVSTDRFQYGYDPDSNVLYKSNLVSSANSELYHINGSTNGYDNLNRLPAFSRGTLNSTHDTITAASRSQTWSLDALGNWTSNTDSASGTQTRSANAQDQQSAISGNIVDNTTTAAVLPTYDNNGNTTKDERGYTFTYDAWNRILTVKNASGVLITTYAYDALGNRISITENGVITDLYYNGQQVIEERQSGTVVNQYVWNLGYVNNLLLRDDHSVTGSLGKSSSGLGVRVFSQHDAVYNTTALTDGTPGSLTLGAVVARFEYDSYGAVSLLTPAWGSTTTDTYHFAYYFQGGRYDAVTGLLHFQARDLSPTLGTWTEKDPTGTRYVDGFDLYQSFGSAPVALLDPSGLAAGDTRSRSRGGDVQSDGAGRLILWWYLWGDGTELTIHANTYAPFVNYLESDPNLRFDVDKALNKRACELASAYPNGGKDISVNIQLHGEVANGEGINGINYLHGSNKTVGDYMINGTANITRNADGHMTVRYNNRYTWNDIIDPNPQYSTDTVKDKVAKIVSANRRKAYRIRIISQYESTYEIKRGFCAGGSGWPRKPKSYTERDNWGKKFGIPVDLPSVEQMANPFWTGTAPFDFSLDGRTNYETGEKYDFPVVTAPPAENGK